MASTERAPSSRRGVGNRARRAPDMRRIGGRHRMEPMARTFAAAVLTLLVSATAPPLSGQAPVATPLKVFKTPTCGCCAKWVEHMRQAGFAPDVQDLPNLAAVKQSTGVPGRLQSCHTALVGDYVIEGHVPADVVRDLLKKKPAVAGIAVPGMPMGSPGMEGPRKDAYRVIAFTKTGGEQVFAER